MFGCGGNVRVAEASEDTEMVICGSLMKYELVGDGIADRTGGASIDNICGGSKSFDPLGGRHMCM